MGSGRKPNKVAPDGVKMEIPWDEIHVGSSIFVPCFNAPRASAQLGRAFKRRGWEHILQIYPENGVCGVRIWRTR